MFTWEVMWQVAVAVSAALSVVGLGALAVYARDATRRIEELERDAQETQAHVASVGKRQLGMPRFMGGADVDVAPGPTPAPVTHGDIAKMEITIENMGKRLDSLAAVTAGRSGAIQEELQHARKHVESALADHRDWRAQVNNFLTRPVGFASNEAAQTAAKMMELLAAEVTKLNAAVANNGSAVNAIETNLAMVVNRLNACATSGVVDASFNSVVGRIENLEDDVASVGSLDAKLGSEVLARHSADEDIKKQLGSAIDMLARHVSTIAQMQVALRAAEPALPPAVTVQ